MKKKLNLVLRDPVKLYETDSEAPVLPSPYSEDRSLVSEIKDKEKSAEIDEKIDLETIGAKNKSKTEVESSKGKLIKRIPEIKSFPKEKPDLREKMSPRIRQVWEYLCRAAKKDGELKNKFTITRAEVMREAQIGSTNTYRDALGKLKNLGLLEIELRPGVTAGSIFYLTKSGLEQAELILEGN